MKNLNSRSIVLVLWIVCTVTWISFSGHKLISKAEAAPAKIHGIYSLFAPADSGDTLIYARVIVDGVVNDADCPDLVAGDLSSTPTFARGMRPTLIEGVQNFNITVCEAVIPPGVTYTVADENNTYLLAAVTLNPAAIQVYGDTGCKLKQCPKNTPASPFKTLAKLGSTLKPDLILHMGDANYRGTNSEIESGAYSYDAGDGGFGGPACGYDSKYFSQNASDSPSPDAWQYWHDDFFAPAKELLGTAPWVFARGNHELCSRAGPGWFYFMGPGSSLNQGVPQLSCPSQGSLSAPLDNIKTFINMIDPYMVMLEHLNLWVFDSANACDEHAANPLTKLYAEQFELLNNTDSANPIWMMTHRPIWGVETNKPKVFLNKMLQTAISLTTTGKLPESVTLSLSGHMHIYQTLTFPPDTNRPPQIVIGNSGVKLDKSAIKGNFQSEIDKTKANGNATDKHGFLTIQYNPNGTWQGEVITSSQTPLAICNSQNPDNNQPICHLQ